MAQAATPISPIDPRVEMFQKGHQRESFFHMGSQARPDSVATDFTEFIDYDTEFEDDGSDMGNSSPRLSLNSDGKRSETTLSSFEEIPTPTSNQFRGFQFNIRESKPVVGPRGPHLFRSSTDSSLQSQDEQYTLTLSPLPPTPITPKASSRPQTAFQVPPVPAIPAHATYSHRPISTLTDAMTNLDKREVAVWTPRQVAKWMNDAGFEPAIVEKFEENDISGAILMTLKFEDLRELDIPSFGKRHKLWNEIHNLRGSLPTTPRPPTPIEAESPVAESKPSHRGREQECGEEGESAPRRRKNSRRKHRKEEDVIYLNPKHGDVISPLDSVSIVGIEQLVPKPHTCPKGEDCSKWRKQQRVIAAFKKEHPVSPEGGMIWIAGNPGNPRDAPPLRPFSDAVPSVVASSDVLGPGEPSITHLEEESLRNVASRDPQDNVKQFLNFQHMTWQQSQVNQEPSTPPYEMFPALSSPTLPENIQPHQGLRQLPKLAIPGPPPARSASANAFSPYRMDRAEAMSPALRNATHSPINGNNVYRFGTPFSEMDVPVTAVNLGPVARDTSQSVPPNMSFRTPITNAYDPRNTFNNYNQYQPSSLNRSNSISSNVSYNENQPHTYQPGPSHLRRPSLQIPPSLPPLHENSTTLSPAGVWSPVTRPFSPPFPKPATGGASFSSASLKKEKATEEDPNAPQHQGTMRKRRTKLLRHEWHEHHFTLRGTRLAMHSDSRALDTLSYIDIDDYAIACSSLSSSKLNAAFRALSFTQSSSSSSNSHSSHNKNHSSSSHSHDAGAFSFQLIPAAIEKGVKMRKRDLFMDDKKKTHHFAVRSRDERIDWMRELMLAKALRRKGEGYEVNLNGNMI